MVSHAYPENKNMYNVFPLPQIVINIYMGKKDAPTRRRRTISRYAVSRMPIHTTVIHVIIVNSYQFMQVLFYLHVCLSAIAYVKEHHFKMNKIHTRRCVSPVVELRMTNHINNSKTIQTNSATVLQISNTEDRNRKQMLDLDI